MTFTSKNKFVLYYAGLISILIINSGCCALQAGLAGVCFNNKSTSEEDKSINDTDQQDLIKLSNQLQQKIDNLEKQAKGYEDSLSKIDNELVLIKQERDKNLTENQNQQSVISALEKQLSEKNIELEKITLEYAEVKKELQSCKEMHEKLSNEILALNTEKKNLELSIEEYKVEGVTHASTVAELEKKITDFEAEIVKYEQDATNATIEKYKTTIQRKDNEISDLKKKITELESKD